ncbi:response regulator transcription factor [Yaniella flava]|uniref:Response regulator transcription factor n=1 Tax=Yaniella flava TaxID=287930 RepID=A0ABP5GCN0_9MICC
MTITVLLVDDHPVVRTGLRAVLDTGGQVSIVAEAASGEEALTLAEHFQPDVVLCDLRLGDGIDGIDTTKALRAMEPAPHVLILSTYDRDADILGAMDAGASGYLLKEATPETITDGIARVAAGQTVLAPEMTSRVLAGMRNPLPELTEREREVLRLLSTGATNKEMAQQLFVAEATVKSHLVHIFTKLGVDNRARAVALAKETGLI